MEEVFIDPIRDRIWTTAVDNVNGLLAVGCGDGVIRIYKNTKEGTRRHLLLFQDGQSSFNDKFDKVDLPVQDEIRSVAFSPDGNFIASACFDRIVRLYYKTDKGYRLVSELSGHTNEAKCVSFSCDSTMLASCGRDRSVWIWDLTSLGNIQKIPSNRIVTCKSIKVLREHTQDVKCVSFGGESGNIRLVSGGYDNAIFVYDVVGMGACKDVELMSSCKHPDMDVQTFKPLPEYKHAHTHTVWKLCVTKDNKIISCCADGSVRLWELIASSTPDSFFISNSSGINCNKLIAEYINNSAVLCIDYQDNYIALACEDGNIKVLEIREGESGCVSLQLIHQMKSFRSPVNSVSFYKLIDDRSKYYITCGDDLGIFKILSFQKDE